MDINQTSKEYIESTDFKKAKTIEEQIEHIIQNKGIKIKESDLDSAHQYLLANSYADVINPLKTLFSTGYDFYSKQHKYDNQTDWDDIVRIHKAVRTIERALLNNILNFELELKSTFCNWLTKTLQKDNITFKQFLESLKPGIKFSKYYEELKNGKNLYQIIEENDEYQKIYLREYNDYSNTNFETRWWLTIMAFSFGELIGIIQTEYKDNIVYNELKKENKNFSEINIMNLQNIRILRNALAHNTNLLIYLDKPLKKFDLLFIEKGDEVFEQIHPENRDIIANSKRNMLFQYVISNKNSKCYCEIFQQFKKYAKTYYKRLEAISKIQRYQTENIKIARKGVIMTYYQKRNKVLRKRTLKKYEI